MVIINYGLFWLNICFQGHALALVTLQHSHLILPVQTQHFLRFLSQLNVIRIATSLVNKNFLFSLDCLLLILGL